MRTSSLPSPPHPAPLLMSSSSLSGCAELDLSVTLNPTPNTGHSEMKPSPPGHTRGKKKEQVCFGESVVVRDAPQTQPIRGQLWRRGCYHGNIRALRLSVEPPAETSNQELDSLEMVELNTTLALKAEFQSLQAVEFNFQNAIQETLYRSERTKNLINARATKVVNVSRSQPLFNSLVSVNVQKDQLISLLLQDRLATRPLCHDNTAADGPSRFLFMSSDLLRQKPFPKEEDNVKLKPNLSSRSIHSGSFDLCRRQRQWEAIP
ncbi:protein phosphatase 1 regulatory subunit 35 [Pleuronectes platessa]|uniref:protein phosphatase 1 regulatory subunit 35 n=1 Tax=Pleuronectes platessa TaxID=8262 RepID=UPI00232A483A|nr:protein phosphatase 1 regulatory subunit 35 [Pleuronectes platessa]XP_053287619.1 protein phosphatase 1 regulatory subunit 35 [Pleuronectes platessa]XP_053287620.1 protein phosphatase 1 regulatory subunit 35 [Pleuronectes platessa]XP_053287621.1 protein phosphatase 1 regulatory subunit 35 [Pleuronectes platessa]